MKTRSVTDYEIYLIDLLHVTSHTGVATTRRHVGVKTRAITSLASRVSSVFNNTSQVVYILFRQCSEYLVENSALRKFQQFIDTDEDAH